MELDFEAISGGSSKAASGGGKALGGLGKSLKKIKPVYLVAAVGGVALVYLFMRRSSSGGTVSGGSVGGGSLGGAGGSDASAIYDAMNTLSGQTSAALSDMAGHYADQFGDLQDAIVAISEKSASRDQELMKSFADAIAATNSRVSDVQSSVGSAVSSATNSMVEADARQREQDAYNAQVEAAKQIKGYSDAWKQLEARAKASGGITADVQNQLDYYATAARQTSINAGFGAGNQDGTGRNIPDAVKKAAGLS